MSIRLFTLVLLLIAASTVLLYKLKETEQNKIPMKSVNKHSAPLPQTINKGILNNHKSSLQNQDDPKSNVTLNSKSIALIRDFFEAIKNKDAVKEQQLLDVVSGLRGKAVTEEIINHLKNSQDDVVKYVAINLLGAMPDANKRATQALIDLLNSSEKTDIRKHVAKVLSSKNDEKVVHALSDVLQKDPNKWLRFESAWSLALIKDKKAVPTLLKVMQTEEDKLVLDKVILAISETADKHFINQLLEISYKSQRKDVQEGVRTILARIDSGTVYGSLVNMLSSTDPDEQKSALRSLAKIEDKEVYPLFETVLRYGQNPDVKKEAISLMAYMNDKKRNAELFNLVLTYGNDRELKIKAIDGLVNSKVEKEKVLSTLSNIITYEKDQGVRRTAINAMASGGYKLEEVSPKLMEVVRYDLNPYAQLDAIQLLKVLTESQKKHEEMTNFFDREAVPILKQMVSSLDKEESVKSYALIVIGMVGNDELIPFLEYIQSTTNSERIQKSASTAIEKIKNKNLSERR